LKRGAQIEAEARSQVLAWEQFLRQAEEAKRDRIAKLSQML
jgi:hypothetical protein